MFGEREPRPGGDDCQDAASVRPRRFPFVTPCSNTASGRDLSRCHPSSIRHRGLALLGGTHRVFIEGAGHRGHDHACHHHFGCRGRRDLRRSCDDSHRRRRRGAWEATLDGQPFNSGGTVRTPGAHTLSVTAHASLAVSTKVVHFTIERPPGGALIIRMFNLGANDAGGGGDAILVTDSSRAGMVHAMIDAGPCGRERERSRLRAAPARAAARRHARGHAPDPRAQRPLRRHAADPLERAREALHVQRPGAQPVVVHERHRAGRRRGGQRDRRERDARTTTWASPPRRRTSRSLPPLADLPRRTTPTTAPCSTTARSARGSRSAPSRCSSPATARWRRTRAGAPSSRTSCRTSPCSRWAITGRTTRSSTTASAGHRLARPDRAAGVDHFGERHDAPAHQRAQPAAGAAGNRTYCTNVHGNITIRVARDGTYSVTRGEERQRGLRARERGDDVRRSTVVASAKP